MCIRIFSCCCKIPEEPKSKERVMLPPEVVKQVIDVHAQRIQNAQNARAAEIQKGNKRAPLSLVPLKAPDPNQKQVTESQTLVLEDAGDKTKSQPAASNLCPPSPSRLPFALNLNQIQVTASQTLEPEEGGDKTKQPATCGLDLPSPSHSAGIPSSNQMQMLANGKEARDAAGQTGSDSSQKQESEDGGDKTKQQLAGYELVLPSQLKTVATQILVPGEDGHMLQPGKNCVWVVRSPFPSPKNKNAQSSTPQLPNQPISTIYE